MGFLDMGALVSVGARVGRLDVGSRVGLNVGPAVGRAVGVIRGLLVGVNVGRGVGAIVGIALGRGVGGAMKNSSMATEPYGLNADRPAPYTDPQESSVGEQYRKNPRTGEEYPNESKVVMDIATLNS